MEIPSFNSWLELWNPIGSEELTSRRGRPGEPHPAPRRGRGHSPYYATWRRLLLRTDTTMLPAPPARRNWNRGTFPRQRRRAGGKRRRRSATRVGVREKEMACREQMGGEQGEAATTTTGARRWEGGGAAAGGAAVRETRRRDVDGVSRCGRGRPSWARLAWAATMRGRWSTWAAFFFENHQLGLLLSSA